MSRGLTSHKVNGLNEAIEILVNDEPGDGGANHSYTMTILYPKGFEGPSKAQHVSDCNVEFQNGPINEAGINGFSNESLLAIVIDRLQGFQSGQFKCRENAIALTHLEDAMHWLQHRTRQRVARGVEGTHAT